jgi:hypothetical protein
VGRGLAAIRDNEEAAECMGVPTLRLKLVATTVSGLLMGLAGGSFPYYLTFIEPASVFDLNYAVNSLAMPMIGGSTTWMGPVIGAILLGLIFIVVTVFLGTMGRIGLIRGTHQVEGSATSLAFGDLFNGSMRYFWRVFGLNLLVGLLVFLAVIILVVVFVFGSIVTLGLFALCAIPLVCLGVPIGWVISVVVEQASIAIVLEDLGIVEGLNRGWAVVKANVGPMILMWLVLGLGVGGIGGFILAIPLFVIVVPAMVGVMSQSQTATSGGLLVAGLCFVAYLPVLIVLNGILRGYIETAWTLTFMRLTNRPAAALAAVEEIPPAA